MRTIQIATDFSEAARRAALYGLQLAKAFNARIILLHAYQQGPVPLADSLVVINREDRPTGSSSTRPLQEGADPGSYL